jgi:peptidoglycan-associated lipoprotein
MRMKSVQLYKHVGALVGALALSFVAGCGHENPPPKAPSTATETRTTSGGNARKSDQDVNVSQDVRMICNIDDSEKSPKFDFDSSSLSSADRDVLQQVAKCMTEGPLKGKNVQLVGRADARGETEYNMGLGESRAQAAKRYLTSLGVGAERLSETSRGELDATGKDEEGYRKDRRVDIRLAK